MAYAFSPSALGPATGGGLSNTLKADPVEGLVQATFEQAAWASFKVQTLLGSERHYCPAKFSVGCDYHRPYWMPDCYMQCRSAFSNNILAESRCILPLLSYSVLRCVCLHKVHANECKCASQLKHKMLNPQAPGVQAARRPAILEEMAGLKKELLADNIKPVGIQLSTDDPELKRLLSASSAGDSL